MGPAAQRWARLQAARGIPPQILARAPADPWTFDARDFAAPAVPADTPSRAAALTLLGGSAEPGGTVLDIGCGGGDASLALVGAATHMTGVDRQRDMLDLFASGAADRGVAHATVLGTWPDVAPAAGEADVVVCHHVLHNVVDLPPFVEALTGAARRGVVVEMLTEHPLAWLDPLWARFHGLRREPPATSDDAVAVLRELGIAPEAVIWERERALPRDPAWVARRLCLGPDRTAEVEAALVDLPPRTRRAATLTWRC